MPTTFWFATNTAGIKGPGTYPTLATEYASLAPTIAVTTEGAMIPHTWRAVANLSRNSLNNTSAQRCRFGRFFSAPFTEDYLWVNPVNSAGAIKFFLSDWENNLNANHAIQQVCIYAWRPSTGAVVGFLSTVANTLAGSKEPTAINTIQNTLGEFFTTAGNLQILAGDILVFEPTGTFTQAAATAYTIRFYYGGTTAISSENTTNTTPASRVVFPYDLPIGFHPNVAKGSAALTASTMYGNFLFLSIPVTATITAQLVDGSYLAASGKATLTAPALPNLLTQVQFSALLQSSATQTANIRQTHELQATLSSEGNCVALPESVSVGDSLALYYSGTGTASDPSTSLGGAIGAPYVDQTVVFDPELPPSLEFVQSVGMPPGTHTFTLDPSSYGLIWEINPLFVREGTYVPGQNFVVVGDSSRGFMVFRVINRTLLLATTFTATTTNRSNSLFRSPPSLGDDTGLYRCLYIFNHTTQDVEGVQLSLLPSTTGETIGIGTEFVSNIGLSQFKRSVTVQNWATDITARGENLLLLPVLQSSLTLSSLGNPLVFSTRRRSQVTDGAVLQVPLTLADERDSTGALSEVQFGPTIDWPTISAGRGVTFWVKKVRPAGLTLPIHQRVGFRLTGNF